MRRRLEPRMLAAAIAALTLAMAPASHATEAIEPGSAQPEPSPAAAEMLKSMYEKGLLTEDEYEELYRRQAKYEVEHRDSLPGWLRDWTFGGDVRFRVDRREFGDLDFGQDYRLGRDNIDVVNERGLGDETRGRLRLRLGAEKKIVEPLTFGFRIATSAETSYGNDFNDGGVGFGTDLDNDPRSANVTMGDFFEPKNVALDRVYLRWQPDFAPTLAVTIGKFANPFVSDDWSTDFLVWDHDIQPEGIAAQYRFDFVPDQLWIQTVGAFFTVQERNTLTLEPYNFADDSTRATLPDIDDQNPFLLGFQGGVHAQPDDWVRTGIRVSYYDLQHIGTRLAAAMLDLGNGGAAIDGNPLFNLLAGPPNADPLYEDGSSQGRTKELVIDGYATFTPWGERWAITPFVQYMTLPDADSENTGWAAGVELGSIELLKITAMYASIERNATISVFTDSDSYEGFTNVKGWYVAAERQIWRGVRVRGAFMSSKQNRDECDQEEVSPALCDTATQIGVLAPYRETTLDRTRWQFDVLVDF